MNTCIMLIRRKVIAKEKRVFRTVLGTNRLIREQHSPLHDLLIYHYSYLSQGTRHAHCLETRSAGSWRHGRFLVFIQKSQSSVWWEGDRRRGTGG